MCDTSATGERVACLYPPASQLISRFTANGEAFFFALVPTEGFRPASPANGPVALDEVGQCSI